MGVGGSRPREILEILKEEASGNLGLGRAFALPLTAQTPSPRPLHGRQSGAHARWSSVKPGGRVRRHAPAEGRLAQGGDGAAGAAAGVPALWRQRGRGRAGNVRVEAPAELPNPKAESCSLFESVQSNTDELFAWHRRYPAKIEEWESLLPELLIRHVNVLVSSGIDMIEDGPYTHHGCV